ncbi:MAG: hypothetical protein RMK57_14980 [Bryobacterales bacterium]|nr:hypothetical protein [Bryobacteraceae bacterium]MDW8355826.1 hypothetical protein [Bryobacterales bacterium]
MRKTMLRAAAICVVTLAAFGAQELVELLQKAPPDVDAALRARISKFYQAHVEGKFREAYDLVADDSKDVFFAAEKPRYRSCNILRIEYSDNFTKARAVVACEMETSMFGNRYVVPIPVTSLWKQVHGQWFWYALPAGEEVLTPAGVMKPGPAPQAGQQAGFVAGVPQISALQNMVRADKAEVRLSPQGESSDTVKITNFLPGSITLSLEYQPVPGLHVELDRPELGTKDSATLMVRWSGQAPARNLTVNVRVMPTAQLIPIRVTWGSPAGESPSSKSR